MRIFFILAVLIVSFSTNVQAQTPCSGMPPVGVIVDPNPISYPDTIIATGYGGVTGLQFNWQFSDSCAGIWTDAPLIPLFVDTVFFIPSPPSSTDSWWRVRAGCIVTGDVSYTNCILIPGDSTVTSCAAWFSSIKVGNGNNMQFFAYPDDPLGTYAWDFGDGNSSFEQNPTHQYTFADTYSVCLNYTDVNGNSCNYCNAVNAFPTATVSGLVYNDLNQNGQQDIGEPGIPNQAIGTDTWVVGYTDSSGNYSLQMPVGINNVQLNPYGSNPTSWAVTNPASGFLTVTTTDTIVYGNNNFGIYINPNYHDVGIQSWCSSPAPGFSDFDYYMLTNDGANTENITFIVQYDPVLTFVQSTPSPTTIDATNHTLTYNLQADPGFTSISAEYICAIGTPLGSPVNNQLSITLNGNVDVYPANDSMNCQSIVVGSFDPNDKQVNPAGVNGNHAINPNHVSQLTYRVRFQNTGTAEAHFITVLDTLDVTRLDVTTFQFLEHSHHAEVQITEGNILRVHFPDIMLPDSFSNEPESHGFFTFRINLQENLPDFSEVHNKAYIYFDYNAPVITNDAFVTLDNTLSLSDVSSDHQVFSLYPNPVDKIVTIDNGGYALVDAEYEIVDVVGRVVMKGELVGETQSVDVTGLSEGMYVMRVFGTSGQSSKVFAVIHR